MGEIKLSLGCGKMYFEDDWVHIDKENYPHIVAHDVTKLNYDDNTVSCIYASHLIAYFDRQEIIPILKEWNRVLKPGGLLQISTPDWDVLKTLPRPLLGPIYGKIGEPAIYHKTIYNYDELFQVLRAAGFIKIEKWEFISGIEDQSSATYDGKEISLNINARKL